MNFSFWWRLGGMAPALWIQGRPRSRLNTVGISTTTKETSKSEGPFNLRSISPQAAALVLSNACTIIPFGRTIDSSVLILAKVIVGQALGTDMLLMSTHTTFNCNLKLINMSGFLLCKLVCIEMNNICWQFVTLCVQDLFLQLRLGTWISLRTFKRAPRWVLMIKKWQDRNPCWQLL